MTAQLQLINIIIIIIIIIITTNPPPNYHRLTILSL
jgi:hypothetical protein